MRRRSWTPRGRSRATGAAVDLEQVRTVLADEVARGLSASGRILPAAAGEDAELAGFLSHVIAVTGGVGASQR